MLTVTVSDRIATRSPNHVFLLKPEI